MFRLPSHSLPLSFAVCAASSQVRNLCRAATSTVAYHRTKTTRAYEHFKLQDLRNKDRFREFYCLFERGGFLPALAGQKPRCDDLLERSEERQREVGSKLYALYHDQRISLIRHLRQPPHELTLDDAIH